MDRLGLDREFWRGRRVLLTGHTGFKGAWLALWLHRLGARVTGYALKPSTNPNLYTSANISDRLVADHQADILNETRLKQVLSDSDPEVIFHLAAQSLVVEGYRDPLTTFSTNVMGTANLLQHARSLDSLKSIVVVTTDKCYENLEWVHPYRESDKLGGSDPYSASKAGTELVTHAFRKSFYGGAGINTSIASARAGNVIGGGDWAKNRLIPDCIRAFQLGEPVKIRSPQSIRPWQHVLEPLAGYLKLAEKLSGADGANFAGAWNFGPDAGGEATVLKVVEELARKWGNGASVMVEPEPDYFPESGVLRLDSTKARTTLGWCPRYSLTDALATTVVWYREFHRVKDTGKYTEQQIDAYVDQGDDQQF